jgi:hypothetical protein
MMGLHVSRSANLLNSLLKQREPRCPWQTVHGKAIRQSAQQRSELRYRGSETAKEAAPLKPSMKLLLKPLTYTFSRN